MDNKNLDTTSRMSELRTLECRIYTKVKQLGRHPNLVVSSLDYITYKLVNITTNILANMKGMTL